MTKTLSGAPIQDMDDDEEMLHAVLDKNGHEILDPNPIAPEVGWQEPPSLQDLIASFYQSARLQEKLAAEGAETFDESNDFEVGDDFDPHSPFEEQFVGQFDESAARAAAEILAAEKAATPPAPDPTGPVPDVQLTNPSAPV